MPLAQMVYHRGHLSADQIQQEVDEFFAELKTSQEFVAGITSNTLTTAELRQVIGTDPIKVKVGSSGLDPLSVSLIVMFAPAANRVAKDLWTTIMLPRIKRRWGDDAIGNEVKDPER